MPKRRSHLPAPVATFVDSEYWRYLDSAAGDGGFIDGFVNHLISRWDTKFTEQENRALVDALLVEVGRAKWHADPQPEQLPLFMIGPIVPQPSYTFADVTKAGRWLRVAARHATVFQVQQDALISRAKADEANEAAAEKEAIVARIVALAHGQMQTRIYDLRDRSAPADAGVRVTGRA